MFIYAFLFATTVKLIPPRKSLHRQGGCKEKTSKKY
jgi:hypothetical protein